MQNLVWEIVVSTYLVASKYIYLTLGALSKEILIFSNLKLCLATAIHNFKCLKICVIFEISVPTSISVSKLKVYFFFNNLLSGVIQVLTETQTVYCSRHQCSKGSHFIQQ